MVTIKDMKVAESLFLEHNIFTIDYEMNENTDLMSFDRMFAYDDDIELPDEDEETFKSFADRIQKTFNAKIMIPNGLEIECTLMSVQFSNTNEISCRGVIQLNGKDIGRWSRILHLNDENPHAYYELLEVNTEYQNMKIGTSLIPHFDAVMLSSGLNVVKLEANIDVGGYAWARQGYDWDTSRRSPINKRRDGSYFGLVGHLQQAQQEFGDENGEIAAMIERLTENNGQFHPNFPTPLEVAMCGRNNKPDETMWAGKKALLGLSWPAARTLS